MSEVFNLWSSESERSRFEKKWSLRVRSSVEVLISDLLLSEVEIRGLKNSLKRAVSSKV